VALKEHGLNFTKIADMIGSNRFVVSQFFKKYSERKNFNGNSSNSNSVPIWTDEEREALVKTLENHGEDYDIMLRNIGNKSRRSITQYIKYITDRFNAKEDLSEFEQRLILALHKPKTSESPAKPAPTTDKENEKVMAVIPEV
jgi:hypothetical protein